MEDRLNNENFAPLVDHLGRMIEQYWLAREARQAARGDTREEGLCDPGARSRYEVQDGAEGLELAIWAVGEALGRVGGSVCWTGCSKPWKTGSASMPAPP
ncbi:hypothetical protein E2493_20395 [Sphingomonas parva]|uniref:Uncharacterized protein n=1 Tax=Sphingomonas parva TaxID=2555898 RepID=A0A4Y8ZK92_9SPHN|nr:hypothetical protein [Sphingomonas parva]TFI56398.1 hypothetical protein E2493_20395 [Sphingomonas parva]